MPDGGVRQDEPGSASCADILMKPGLTELLLISPAEHPRIGVVFVHGLDGDARDS